MAEFLELSFELGALDAEAASEAGFGCGACAVSFVDARDDPVYEPTAGELRLWRATRVKCLFTAAADRAALTGALAAALGVDAALIGAQLIADRAWEGEWLKDFHAMRFGRRLWVAPHHERVAEPGALTVHLDPGLAFGTGTHASTGLCLSWLDECLPSGTCVIDYGCGSGVLALAAARLGAAAVHAFDIDNQALIATRDNARANGLIGRLRIHSDAQTLPHEADVLLANILAPALCELAPRFAALLRPGGEVVLAGLLPHESAGVTAAYDACFDVTRYGERDGWVCLTGRRH